MPNNPPAIPGNAQSGSALTNEDYYMTPDGFLVFTAVYHRKRGYCCKNGCRHCPYVPKKTGE